MLRFPAFPPHITPVVIPGEGVLLLDENSSYALYGKIYEKLANLIDGRRDTAYLIASLADDFSAAKVTYALFLLENKGYISEAAPAIPSNVSAFWSGLGLDPQAASNAISAKSVHLRTVGSVDPSPIQESLASFGICVSSSSSSELEVVLTDDYLRPQLINLNKVFHSKYQNWLLVKPNGYQPWVGPLYRPGTPGCHGCLVHHLRNHKMIERFALRRLGSKEALVTAKATLPASKHLIAEMVAIEIAKHLAASVVAIDGTVISVDTHSLSTHTHRLNPYWNCSVCGQPSQPKMKSVTLVRRQVQIMHDGGYRCRSPEETLEHYKHLVSPITGVVRVLASGHPTESIAKVFVAGRNPVFEIERLEDLKASLRTNSAGKGVTKIQAKVSALCEAIERYSCQSFGDEFVITNSYLEMCSRYPNQVIHPNDVMLYSHRQFCQRDVWNAKQSRFNSVPELLDETVPIDWTPVWSLSENQHKFLPSQLLYFQRPASDGFDRFFAFACSNGAAAGNNIEEAILQGFFELVERDAAALWWYNRLPKAEVDILSFNDPYLRELNDLYDSLGRQTWALDLTSDLEIPTFTAISKRREGTQDHLLFGFGCHLDARIALQRAYTEMNQMLLTAGRLRQGPGVTFRHDETLSEVHDPEILHWLHTATLENQSYMAPGSNTPARRLDNFQHAFSGELLNDINHCRGIVEGKGMEMLIVDQTRPGIDMPVVKVIVPGLRHFWARFAPGRLFTVPVDMGWLKHPLKEEELNPISIFF